jgi:hypothetical protein
MNCTEDQFRGILRAEAADITAESVPPLSLPGASPARSRPATTRGRRWLVPLGAGAAVTAIAVAATVLSGGGRAPQPSVATPGLWHGVPAYYVAILGPPRESGLVITVRDTGTGAVLATVHAPKGYQFAHAAAGRNDDSFLLAAGPLWPAQNDREWFYVLGFNPATLRTTLVRLPIPATRNLSGFTESPGGTELAVSTADPNGSQIRIYTLSGRLTRQWQDPGYACPSGYNLPCPSWAASGNLAFTWVNSSPAAEGLGHSAAPITGPSANGIRMIRATAASGSLVGASRLAVPFPDNNCVSVILSGDGKTIAAGVQLATRNYAYDVYEEFSATTGKLTARYWQTHAYGPADVYWSNQMGTTLIVMAAFPRTSQKPEWLLGILAGGRFTSLPTPSGLGLPIFAF